MSSLKRLLKRSVFQAAVGAVLLPHLAILLVGCLFRIGIDVIEWLIDNRRGYNKWLDARIAEMDSWSRGD